MKKTRLIIAYLSAVILILGMLNACRKDSHSEQNSTVLTVKQAQSLYETDKKAYTGDPAWDRAYTYSQSDTGVTLKVPLSASLGIKELVFVQYKDQSIHQYVLYTLPDLDYIKEKSVRLNKALDSKDLIGIDDYTGVIYTFQTDGKFIEGAIYQSGSILNTIKPKVSQAPTTGSKYQTLDGGNDANCLNPRGPWVQYCQTHGMLPPVIVSPPPSGGGGGTLPIGTTPPPIPVGTPGYGGQIITIDLNSVYGFGGTSGVSDEGRLSCQSFTFKKLPGGANSQEAGVSGLGFVVDWITGAPARRYSFRTIYINLGVTQANGNVITPGKAAEIAASAANRAGASLTVKYYGQSSAATMMDVQVENEFLELLNVTLQQDNNGYANASFTQKGNNTVTKPAVWNGSVTRIFNALAGRGCAEQ